MTTEMLMPFQFDAVGGVAAVNDYSVIIAQHVRSVVLTAVGERVMRPRYGSTAIRTLFDFNDPGNRGRLISSIRSSLSLFEPNITVIDLVADPMDPNNPTTLTLKLVYSYREGTSDKVANVSISGNISTLRTN